MRSLQILLVTLAGIAVEAAPIPLGGGGGGGAILGSSVTGTFNYNGGPTNLFDPANIAVSPSYLNHGGPTVTITDPGIEFGFTFFTQNAEVDFTGTQLKITFVSGAVVGGPWTMDFADNAFKGISFTKSSDTFENGLTATLLQNTLSFSYQGTISTGTGSAVFNLTSPAASTPEPTPAALLLLGLCGLAPLAIRRRRGR